MSNGIVVYRKYFKIPKRQYKKIIKLQIQYTDYITLHNKN